MHFAILTPDPSKGNQLTIEDVTPDAPDASHHDCKVKDKDLTPYPLC
jgi:hypothetical protein